ncbi:hypothetical protein HRR83_005902 [Exophiala dermatitidis]|uniref:Uncharacterized protein n=1 Tax=Exophiala dermatitidis TaxID=5970 RepID=A0AAN6EN40_EXODE|nr:hypothetical protein HRR75_007454 [Exophiala dermatitidis]KAJ4507200.1 hypothetical protein HRR74_008123 [Exophiala dermatitidis]KAJ4517325.1 hypothetical protein HRR73_004377 [Exophiala dermatitidis]KAJ4548929.1 hypothetical protein HRR76_001504 [Exophiala dermatitidis]KAJ4550701.1 hypothetical protein HRR78_004470 [Exophiala dermatitidis]
MPLPVTKPKIPEYPRPVSPICADEIPVCDDTIIYYDGNKDVEEDPEHRAAKRRRIETYAAAYRRGESLFIATAQLKGPFDKGWKNPWPQKRRLGTRTTTAAKRSTRSSNRTTTALNETAGARKAAVRNEGPSCAPPRKSLSPSPQIDADEAVRPESSKGNALALKREPFSATKGSTHASSSRRGKARSEENIKPEVEHWLKRNDSYMQADDAAQISFSSPLTKKSPHPHPRTKKWESSPIQAPPVLDPLVGIVVKSFRTEGPIVSAGSQENGQHSEDLRSGVPSTKRPVTTRGLGSFSGQAGAHQEVAIPAHTAVHVNPLPAEETHVQFANIHAEPSADLTTPNSPRGSRLANSASEPRPNTPGALPKTTGSRPEPTLSDTNVQHGGLIITEAATNSTSLQGAEPKPSPVRNSSAASPKDRLHTNKTHSLPSAQIPAQQTLPSGPSDLSSNGEMSELQTIQALPDTNEVQTTVGDIVRLDFMSEHDSVTPKAGEQPKMPTTDNTPGAESAGTTIQPFEPVTARKRAANSVRGDSHSPTNMKNCAATAARLTKTKRAKKTSFNTTSQRSPAGTSTSQGSITSAMKIAKPATALHLNQNEVKLKGKYILADSESDSESKSLEDDNDDNTGITKTPTPRGGLGMGPGRFSKYEGGRGRLARNPNSNSNSGPKSILKPSGPLPASSSLGARARISSVKGGESSSSSKHWQDAQPQPAKLRAMAVEADSQSQVPTGSGDVGGSGFDLDAAIDDLGSFLGTWEAEKEAAQLGNMNHSQRSFIAGETV